MIPHFVTAPFFFSCVLCYNIKHKLSLYYKAKGVFLWIY